MEYALVIEEWALHHLGREVLRDSYTDPRQTIDNFQQQRDAVRECFPRVEYQWLTESPPAPDVRCGRTVTQGELFGAEVDRNTDTTVSHPWSRYTSAAEVDAITIPNIRECPGYRVALKKYKRLAAVYNGFARDMNVGFLAQHGKAVAAPLSYTLDMVGQDLFIHMYANPELAHAFLRKTMQVHEMLWDVKREVESCEFYRSYLADCPNTMCSPETFREFVLPYNKQFATRFPNLESHNCGKVTHLLEYISDCTPFKWVEIGWGTDLTEAREHFKDQLLLPRLGVSIMQTFTPQQVYDTTCKILHSLKGGPVSLHSDCIKHKLTSPETLNALFAAVSDTCNSNPAHSMPSVHSN